jgi:N-acyl-D-amino-acid deacylase
VRVPLKLVPVLILAATLRAVAAEPDLSAFDQSIIALMARYDLPGATVAVAREGKLVIARAYGVADREHHIPTQPDSLFRIASISKTLTSTAILVLVDQGRLTLETRVFPLLDQLQPPKGKQPDPRLATITVRQLLQHTGGWDTAIEDPLALAPDAARELNVPAPVGPDDLIRYVMGRPLAFDPGARLAYSNFGYEVLGRVIEKVARMPYEDYVKLAVLAPTGVHRMRVGASTLAQRADGEVIYYDVQGAPLMWTQVRGGPPIVPRPYFYALGEFDACGAWIASAIDLARFALAMDEGSGHALLLQPATLRQAREDRVPWPGWTPPGGKRFYGLGWIVDVSADGTETWWHSGGLPGTTSLLLHRPDGIVLTALFNSNPYFAPSGAGFGDLAAFGDAYQAFAAALNSIGEWPTDDLFGRYQ